MEYKHPTTSYAHPPIRIIADDRERGSGVIEKLRTYADASVSTARLITGDYRADNTILFERKTLRDLAMSIIDGRLFRQASRLAGSGVRPVMILEGMPKDLEGMNIARGSMQGALIAITVFYGIPVLRTIDAADTAHTIMLTARQSARYASGALKRPGYRPKGEHARRLFILQGIPGIGARRAELLLQRFGSIHKIVNASEAELMEIEGIAEGVARKMTSLLRGTKEHATERGIDGIRGREYTVVHGSIE
ncbi:MAG: ERCC4 domain-containing protein [Spirochaetota bacterium]